MNYTNISTRELLELVIGVTATEARFDGSLHPLFDASDEHVSGDLFPLLAAKELLRRWLAEGLKRHGESFPTPEAVKKYLNLEFSGQSHESFVVLYLDAQNRLIEAEEPFRGTLTQTSVFPREIVKRALYWNAAAVMFAHNHPSGVTEPSKADEFLTRALGDALKIVDVRVLDHFIIAGNAVMSFAERGLL